MTVPLCVSVCVYARNAHLHVNAEVSVHACVHVCVHVCEGLRDLAPV